MEIKWFSVNVVIVSSYLYDYTLVTACVHRIGMQLENLLKSDVYIAVHAACLSRSPIFYVLSVHFLCAVIMRNLQRREVICLKYCVFPRNLDNILAMLLVVIWLCVLRIVYESPASLVVCKRIISCFIFIDLWCVSLQTMTAPQDNQDVACFLVTKHAWRGK
jgi:hypothetical protein